MYLLFELEHAILESDVIWSGEVIACVQRRLSNLIQLLGQMAEH
jgi:hypothetical protein